MTTGRTLIRSLPTAARFPMPKTRAAQQQVAPPLTPPRTRNASRSTENPSGSSRAGSTSSRTSPPISLLEAEVSSPRTRPVSPPASRPHSPGGQSRFHTFQATTSLQSAPSTPYESSGQGWLSAREGQDSFGHLPAFTNVPLVWGAPRGHSLSQLMPPPPIPGRERPSSASQDAKSVSEVKVQPPRPPNAWILYRSDKLKAIAAGEMLPGVEDLIKEQGDRAASTVASTSASSGEDAERDKSKGKGRASIPKPRKGAKDVSEGVLKLGSGKHGRGLPQARISTLISAMWRAESKEVRSKYERLSDARKLEHQAKYPNYKFQPMRKQDKAKLKWDKEMERQAIKEEKDRERERERATAPQVGPGRPIRNKARSKQSSPYKTTPGHHGSDHSAHLPHGPLAVARALTFPGDDERRAHRHPRDHMAENIAAGTTVFWANEETYPPLPGTLQPAPLPASSSSSPYMVPYGEHYPLHNGSVQWEYPSMPDHAASYHPLPSDYSVSVPNGNGNGSDYLPMGNTPHPERGFLVVPGPPNAEDSQSDGPPAWDSNYYAQPYAIPYMFEPLPLPDDLEVGEAPPYDDDAMQDGKSMAAMWCLLEEEADIDPGLPTWDVDSSEAVNQWSELGNLPEGSEPAVIDLSSSLASRIASSWAQEQSLDHTMAPTAFMPNNGYLSFQYDEPRVSQVDRNPTLFEAMPLSPADGSFNGDTGVPMGDSTTGGNRRVSAAVSDFGVPPATPADLGLQPPSSMSPMTFVRYVSNSAYPQRASIESESGDDDDLGNWAETREGGLPAPLSFDAVPMKEGRAAEEDLAWNDEDTEPRVLSFGASARADGAQAAPNARRRGRVVASTYAGELGGE